MNLDLSFLTDSERAAYERCADLYALRNDGNAIATITAAPANLAAALRQLNEARRTISGLKMRLLELEERLMQDGRHA